MDHSTTREGQVLAGGLKIHFAGYGCRNSCQACFVEKGDV